MITTETMPYETMQKRVDSHSCGVCQGNLTIAWGGAYGFNGYILRCGNDINHDILTDYKRPSPEYEEGNKLFRRLYGMDSTALMNMNKETMLARVSQAKFPKDLTKDEKALIAEVSRSYGLDPLMQELMIYQGNPYLTINARYRKAQETGLFDGIDTRPATKTERSDRNAKDGDYLYRCEVWKRSSTHPFVGWGRVRGAETQGDTHLPVVKDPDRQAEKRAEVMALRKAFSMPIPFQSWEEFQEQAAAEKVIITDSTGKVLNTTTGEITEPEAKPEASTSVPEKQSQGVTQEEAGQSGQNEKNKGVTKRDTATIKTITDMYKACHVDFGMQPAMVMAELNVNSWKELTLTPAEAYRTIASVHTTE